MSEFLVSFTEPFLVSFKDELKPSPLSLIAQATLLSIVELNPLLSLMEAITLEVITPELITLESTKRQYYPLEFLGPILSSWSLSL